MPAEFGNQHLRTFYMINIFFGYFHTQFINFRIINVQSTKIECS